MEIVENKALVLRTRNPSKFDIIPRSKHIGEVKSGIHEVAVYWGLDEARVLKNLGVRDVPSPILRNYAWPGKYKPFDHQVETAAFLTLNRRAFCFSEPGTGKTLSSLWAADYLMEQGVIRRCLIICPLSIMQSAWLGDISKSIVHRTAAVAYHTQASRRIEVVQNDYEFVICNFDGLPILADTILKDGRFDLIIGDECFVAGTQVETPDGGRNIEDLNVGDPVLTSIGVKRIRTVICNTSEKLVNVRLSNGKELTCTEEHPFFTDIGWVSAKDIAGRRLVSADDLRDLRWAIPDSNTSVELAQARGYANWADLLAILCAEESAHAKPDVQLLQQDETRREGVSERHRPQRSVSSTHVAVAESQKTPTSNTGRERYGDVEVREDGIDSSAYGVRMELPRSVREEAARLSYLLQAGLRRSGTEGRTGSRWQQSFHADAKGTRREERRQASGTWVERVSRIQQTSRTVVYNLEVEGAPNYFVERCLVHNCNAYKNASTDRWKYLNKIVKPETTLWLMTGTPAAQSPLDAYGLAKLVNPTAVPRFATAWRDRVMRQISKFKWIPKEDADTVVHTVLQPAIRFTKAQCLDLPAVVTMTREVPLTAQQLKCYRNLRDLMMIRAAGETVTAINAAAMVNKLLQISAGAAYTDANEVIEFDCKPRLNVLLEVLEETDRKVLVFAPYRHSIDTIADFLTKEKVPFAKIHGDVSASARSRIFDQFQTTPEPRVLVIQPQAASHGVTLTAADTVVFWGPVMSVETYIQCCARSDRQGQDSDKVTVVHIQGSDIERRMFKRLMGRVMDHGEMVKLYEEEIEDFAKL